MGPVRTHRDDLAVDDDRQHHREVGKVAPAPVGVVAEDHVARRELVDAELSERPLHRERHRAEMQRIERGLRDHLAGAVEHGARVIASLVEDRRVRGPSHRDAHLLGQLDQRAADDLERDQVHRLARDPAHAAPSVISSEPVSWTSAVCAG